MGLKNTIVERGRQALFKPSVMRWATSDRVLKATEGVLDAKTRVQAAWQVLLNGHALPSIDPALDDSIAQTEVSPAPKPRVRPTNGNGQP